MRIISRAVRRLAVAWIVLPTYAVIGQVDVPKATLHIEVFSAFGEKVRFGEKGARVTLFAEDTKNPLVREWTKSEIPNVPFGYYRLVAAVGGGGSGVRDIRVNTKHLFIKIGCRMPAGEALWPPGGQTIRGKITPTPKDSKRWWVMAQGVYLDERREAPVSQDGHFAIPNLDMGRYLLTVFEEAQVRHAETLEIDTRRLVNEINVETKPK